MAAGWDYIVSTNLLPLGGLVFALFCCSDRFGWGWDNMIAEANAGKGMKVQPFGFFFLSCFCGIILEGSIIA